MKYQEILNRGSKILKLNNIKSYNLDSEILLSTTLKLDRSQLILNLDKKIENKEKKNFLNFIKRRTKNEPIAYITGYKEFWKSSFKVDKNVLIPRPDTETIIEQVLKELDNYSSKKILDIGTGSGCILISILNERKKCFGVGIDISKKAIQIANVNSKRIGMLNRSKFKVMDLEKLNEGKYDLIVSNPPYIPTKDIKNLSKDIINHEPIVALNGGVDGLDLIKKVIYKSNHLLKREGLLALEIGYSQYQRVSYILRCNGYREMSKEYDFNRNVRCIIGTKVRFF